MAEGKRVQARKYMSKGTEKNVCTHIDMYVCTPVANMALHECVLTRDE